eukprot:scaffold43275_cov67-Cyclotella_meneghiniana.AAC.2
MKIHLTLSKLYAVLQLTSSASASNLFQAADKFDDGPHDSIIGGTVANIDRYPYTVALARSATSYYTVNSWCTGTLISPDTILTSARCMLDNENHFWIKILKHDLAHAQQGNILSSSQWIKHPEYNSNTMTNDIAVMFLSSPLSDWWPMSYPKLNQEDSYPVVGETRGTARAMGWGHISYLGVEPVKFNQWGQYTQEWLDWWWNQWVHSNTNLHEVDLPVISNSECDQNYTQREIDPSDICTYSPEKLTCLGDYGKNNKEEDEFIVVVILSFMNHSPIHNIGGPLIIPGATAAEDTLIGVIGKGMGCDTPNDYPGVYARVSYHMDWIKETVCANSSDPPADLCVDPAPVTSFPVSPAPTRAPSKNPTKAPSKAPTKIPTKSPTVVPTTKAPSPTSSGNGPQNAVYDGSFGAPVCASFGNSCSSGTLLNGRGFIRNGYEPNQPNTLDGCTDGLSGFYHSDESIDKVIVRAGDIDTPSTDDMKEGDTVTIVATVWAWSTGASDRADFYYASDATNPEWQYIGTKTPPSGGAHDLMMSYTLPQGGFNERDDIVFTVGGSHAPTPSVGITAAPTPMQGGGPQEAVYDAALGAPRCILYGSKCDSLDLVNGRGTISNGNELNRPNTLDTCTDGNYGSYHFDESIDKIVVVSGEIDGTGSDVDMVEGGRVTIIATVWPWSSGSGDYADFYYASDASNPQWVLIGTKQPTGSGLQEIKVSYNLPSGASQAIRVNFRYRGVQGSNGACSSGSYDDNDDLAFTDEVHDAVADFAKRKELDANKRVKRGSKTSKKAKRA